ncbi:SET domain-containing protein-lysine N-methyltransferase [Candidatus Kaiserbacteria bacterium]|nr:MAG: SET domain-containing protein-lysine N-methyltransferase [Candidatus Kaiserbacteria bacterium]
MNTFNIQKSFAGEGLFTQTPIKKGEFLIEYVGELITSKEADSRKTKYLFELNDDYTIDGEEETNLARYINHFCEPNSEVEIENGRINFYATRDIKAGEELGIDYGKEYTDEFIKECKCPDCS